MNLFGKLFKSTVKETKFNNSKVKETKFNNFKKAMLKIRDNLKHYEYTRSSFEEYSISADYRILLFEKDRYWGLYLQSGRKDLIHFNCDYKFSVETSEHSVEEIKNAILDVLSLMEEHKKTFDSTRQNWSKAKVDFINLW